LFAKIYYTRTDTPEYIISCRCMAGSSQKYHISWSEEGLGYPLPEYLGIQFSTQTAQL